MVAFFGSQGLYAYDLAGTLKWKRDLGRLDAGAYDDPSYEWGNGQLADPLSGPRDRAVRPAEGLVPDRARLKDGSVAWRTSRDELPSWATPNVFPGSGKGAAGARDERAEVHPRLRPEDRAASCGGWAGAPTSPRRRPIFDGDLIVVDERPAAERAHLRAEGRRARRHHAPRRRDLRRERRVDARRRPAPTCRRRSSTAASSTCCKNQGILDLLRPAHGRAALRAAAARRDERLQRLAGGGRRQALSRRARTATCWS